MWHDDSQSPEVVHLLLQPHDLSSLVNVDTLQVLCRPRCMLPLSQSRAGRVQYLQNVSAYKTVELMRCKKPGTLIASELDALVFNRAG